MLPDWAPGTVAILATAGDGPSAIPLSTAVRVSDSRVAFALARRRTALQRLRDDPRCALALLAGGDVAVTLHGVATVLQDPMEVSDRVVALALDVERVQDHGTPRFVIDDGVQWRWTDEEARQRDAVIRAALASFR